MTEPKVELDELLDIRAIEQAIIAFARGMDAHDWPGISEILTDDAQADFGAGRLFGRAAIVGIIRSYLDSCGTTQHLIGNTTISVDGDRATSRAYVRDIHLPKGDEPGKMFFTLGDYHDSWVRQDGRWRLAERIKDNRAIVGSLSVFAM